MMGVIGSSKYCAMSGVGFGTLDRDIEIADGQSPA